MNMSVKQESKASGRARTGTLAGILGIAVNVLLFVFKFVAGTLTGSLAIAADAWNNLSDAGSSVISLIGFRIAAKPADREHPFGHARMESIASFMVACIILLIGGELLLSSFGKIFAPAPPTFRLFAALVLALSMAAKLVLFFVNRRLGKKIGSDVLLATATDSLNDVLSTGAVLLSQLLFLWFGWNLDAYIGLGVAGLIIYAGFGILRDTQNTLLGEAPVGETVEDIRRIVFSYPEALGIHDLLVHSYGVGHTFATLHVEVDGARDVFETHDVIDLMERRIADELGIQCTIHLDPIVTDDEQVNALRRQVEVIASEVESRLTVHDFRFVQGVTHTNLIFDLVVPFECRREADDYRKAIADRLSAIDPRYLTVISIDWA